MDFCLVGFMRSALSLTFTFLGFALPPHMHGAQTQSNLVAHQAKENQDADSPDHGQFYEHPAIHAHTPVAEDIGAHP